MGAVLQTLAELLMVHVVYPIVLDFIMRRELDPTFKAKTDEIYGELKAASTTAERKAASRKLYELQKANG